MAALQETVTALATRDEDIALVTAEINEVKAKIQKIKNDVKVEKCAVKDKQAEIEKARAELAQASVTAQLRRTISLKTADKMAMQAQLVCSNQELGVLQQQLGGLQQQLGGLQQQAGGLQNNLANIIFERLTASIPLKVLEPDDTAFFESLSSGKADRKSTIFDAGRGVFFPLDLTLKRSKLFVRSCFVGLFEDIRDSDVKQNVVSGTAGVGKSFFMYYCFYKLLQLQNNKSPLAPSRILWEHVRAPGCVWLLDKDGKVYRGDRKAFEMELQDKSAWYFADEVAPMLVAARTILFTLPKTELYDAMERDGANVWYMPLWTDRELLSCREAVYPSLDSQRVKSLFQHYGGVVRYVLGLPSLKEERFDLDELDHALRTCNVSQVRNGFGGIACGPEVNHRILHMAVDRRTYKPLYLTWASKYVEYRFIEQALNGEKQFLLTLLNGSKGQLQGHLFEAYMHRQLELGGDFLSVGLERDDFERGVTDTKVFQPCLSRSFHNFGEIKADGSKWVYWRPYSPTFPNVTSLLMSPQSDAGCRLFKFTTEITAEVSRSDLKDLVGGLLASKLLQDGESCNFYFVVPKDVFGRFKLKAEGAWFPVEQLNMFILCEA